MEKLYFASDYQEGVHPAILEELARINGCHFSGYGQDRLTESAREAVRRACSVPEAEVFFLTGGTQANRVVIQSMLKPWQGVIAAESGHISAHEAGAIEAGGHKVIELPQKEGKLQASVIAACLRQFREDVNRNHMVEPGMVYLSQPTEMGTLYSLKELEEIRTVCTEYNLALYVDGARLAYALGCRKNDVSLSDLGRLCDVFYIGGTKCGAMMGEAVVIPKPGTIPHFFTLIKQQGALMAKGWMLAVQFACLLEKDRYRVLGAHADTLADKIRSSLQQKGYRIWQETPTNQIFVLLEDADADRIGEQVVYSFWEKADEGHTVIRLATSWATKEEDVQRLQELL